MYISMIYIEVLLRVYVKVGLEPIISRKKSVVALPFLLIYHAIGFTN